MELLCSTAKSKGRCPLWVTSGHRVTSALCPLYPRKRTFPNATLMSALGQKQTFRGCGRDWRYSITSSARTSNEAGMVIPMALAVLRLITKSNFDAK
jgi:hypothetical protein